MPLKAFKCVVELTIHEVTAPGVRLANKEDLYLNVCLLGQQRRTRLVPPLFPAKFSDHLIFEKTFKFCRDALDVANFLNDLHVLVELIQLGRSEKNEVLAWYETSAKEFLYPTAEIKPSYHSAQRDVFMIKDDEFPGNIAPQLIFCTSTCIDETQTPSLDILREYENRFVNDPLIDMNKKERKKSGRAHESPIRGILRHNSDNFSNHTISSAIKADYLQPDVRFKLDELNTSVKKTKVVKEAPGSTLNSKQKPFVVRKVEEKLIHRKPELHDVLHDGLVLTKKNRSRRKKRSVRSRSEERRSASSANESSHRESSDENSNTVNNSALFHTVRAGRAKSLDRAQSPHSHKLGISLNKNLKIENDRPRAQSTSSRSRSNSRHTDRTYDILPEFERNQSSLGFNENKKFDTTLENCNVCSNTHSNCEVCSGFRYRTQQNFRGHRFHRDETNMNKAMNSSSIFNKSAPYGTRDPLNETRYLNSDDLAHIAFADSYRSNSFKEANETSNHVSNSSKKHSYPKNRSFSNYAPPSSKIDWRYTRYYPWLFNYTEYLRELEDELMWLKTRSRHLGHH